MKRSKVFSLVVLIILAMLVSACGKPAAPTQPAQPADPPIEVVIGYSGPLSGPAAEYGQDCLNGIDYAVKEIAKNGGFTVNGKKYIFKLEYMDDGANPTQAVTNARRFRDQYKTPAIFNPVFTAIAPMMELNQEKGNEFIMMAYTSTPTVTKMNNELVVMIPPPFDLYIRTFSEMALERGWKKGAMVVTLGAYGDAWRKFFKGYWEAVGGTITADQPGNYYTEVDFSAQITAAIATNPDFMLIGGPSQPTALVIEQARALGYKGGFILIDQAKMEYIESLLGGLDLMNDVIGVGRIVDFPSKVAPTFDKAYNETYKVMNTWESVLNYTMTHGLARAMSAAGSVDDARAIRAAFDKAFPLSGDEFPSEYFGIDSTGRTYLMPMVGSIKDGKYQPPVLYAWWPKSEAEVNQLKEKTAVKGANIKWIRYE